MDIGRVAVTYLSHVCFQFRSPSGRVLLTDPFFADGFEWKGRHERYLSPPEVDLGEIRLCDVVFVSHIHGDHFDPGAVLAIQKRTGATVIGPADVVDVLVREGASADRLIVAEEGKRLDFHDLVLGTYCGYDNSRDAQGRDNKFSLLIECGPTALFYSGDCHELPPAVRGAKVDATFCWPHPDDDKLVALCLGLDTRRFVLMHGDRFEPGDFFCNIDHDEQKRRIEGLVPGVEVIVPDRARSLSST